MKTISQLNLEKAIPYAEAGWYIFPAFYDGTHKGCIAWGEGASNQVADLQKWAAEYPSCYFCVHLKKSGVVVVDIDDKNNKNGSETLNQLCEIHGQLPETLVSTTPSGGWHLYFQGTCAVGANKLGTGVDVAVMTPLPNQTAPGKGEYLLSNQATPAPLPGWIMQVAGAAGSRAEDRDIDMTEPDLAVNITRATTWLQHHSPEATEGSGGDHTTYTVACTLRDMGIAQETAFRLMLDHWNPTRAHPPWSPEELQHKVYNAFKYARDRLGNNTPEAVFGPVNTTIYHRSDSPFHCAKDLLIEHIEPRDWIMQGRYLSRYITMTVGPGAEGKSALCLAEAMSIATNRKLTHAKIYKHMPTLYYNGEDDKRELDRKIWALASHYGLNQADMQHFHYQSGRDMPFILAAEDRSGVVINEQGKEWFINKIRSMGIGLLVLDPLVEFHMVDENNNRYMLEVMKHLRHIAEATGCAISLVHHTGKGVAAHGNQDRARGASSMVNAARIAHTLFRMTEEERQHYSLNKELRKFFVRLDSAKANLEPPSDATIWYRHMSVDMPWDGPETVGTIQHINRINEVIKEANEATVFKLAVSIMGDKEVMKVMDLARAIHGMDPTLYTIKTLREKLGTMFKDTRSIGPHIYGIFFSEGAAYLGKKSLQFIQK